MKIGLVLPQVPGYSETFFSNKINLLTELGHQIFVFAENPNKISIKGVNIVEPLSLKKELSLSVLFQFLKALFYCFLVMPIRSFRFLRYEIRDHQSATIALNHLLLNVPILVQQLDWIHFGFATMGLGRENVGKTMNAKMSVSFRGYDIAIYPLKFPGCYSLLWQKLDKVHTISDDLLAIAYQSGLPRETPVMKINPAIDVEKFYCSNRTGEIGKKLKILSVGRLHWKKGYEYAFRALAKLKQDGLDFEMVIVGSGSDLERCKYSLLQLGLSEDVTLAGRMSPDQIASYMQQFDVYMQPSVQEGFGNSVLEAQSSGLFCIVSDAEGLSENILHGKTGIVVPKRSAEALVGAVMDFIKMPPQQRLQVIRSAQRRTREIFALELQKEKFNEFYRL